jgi:RNA dependent RNA polymerase
MTLSQMNGFANIRKATQDADLKPMSYDSTTISNDTTNLFRSGTTGSNLALDTAATSFEEASKPSSQDLALSQEMEDLLKDPAFKISFNEACQPSRADLLFDRLCEKSPLNRADILQPLGTSFRHRFELQRVADALTTSLEVLLQDMRKKGISSSNDYNTFWAACQAIPKKRDHHLPEKSSSSAWNSATKTFFESETRARSVYLAGVLSLKSKSDDDVFEFYLKPLQLDRSCRFHRQYGPSRFMVLHLPSTSISGDIPEVLKQDARSGVLSNSVARWLTTKHTFLGRTWIAFFLEPEKKKSKSNAQSQGHKVHLFAVSGDGLPVIQIDNFLNWHLRFEHNRMSTDLKLFQRLSLGLSKTIATVTLLASEFVRLPDPVGHAVMNDGCARMSKTLARDIARIMNLNDIPSVYQGRIAGAKGLWMAVPDDEFYDMGPRNYCIEIADSQLKIKPHPANDGTSEEAQRTFEVLSYSAPGKPAALNTQLLTILHDRGVQRQTLGELLVADIGTFHADLEESMHRPFRLRSLVQSRGLSSRADEEVRMTGSWPDEAEEQAIMLIENGFTPDTSSLLVECLRSMLQTSLEQYVDRLQIRIPCSTYLYCVADPYGILEPNEVHLSFSEVWKDPVSGFKESFVDGRDILVARLPALLPSDVQRRQAVWKRELHHLKDVIVFSTKGEIPLAHMLSGGDYDGDTPWICWDEDIVRVFKNADMPKTPTKKDCGLVQQSRWVKDVFAAGMDQGGLASHAGRFLANCFEFNLHPSYLGQCTLEHEKVVYFVGDLSAPNAVMLAALSGYLVDSAKQGDLLSDAGWLKIRKQVSPQSRQKPAYKNAESSHHKRQSNIIDFLKFWQAVPEKDRILTQFHGQWPQQHSYDSVLCQPWRWMKSHAKGLTPSAELPPIINQLLQDVKEVVRKFREQQPKEENRVSGQFRQAIENFCHQFRTIEPSAGKHEFSSLWVSERGKRFGHWSLLRASCLYSHFNTTKLAWYFAGEELCQIRAQADSHGYRTVLNHIYPLLKCDSKTAKRAQDRLEDVYLEEEVFGYQNPDMLLMTGPDE